MQPMPELSAGLHSVDYPGYLTVKEDGDKVSPELKITEKTPPTFIAMAEDDPHESRMRCYALALKKEKVPVNSMSIRPVVTAILRPTKNLVTTWPNRVEDWMRSRDLLKKH
jgi:hypothetical protein